MKPVLLTALLALATFSACGKTIPAVVSSEPGFVQGTLLGDNQASWLVGTWQAQGEGGKAFSLEISAGDSSFIEEVQVQVGKQGDRELPASMICRFRKSGSLKVESATEVERTYYKEQGKTIVPELTLLAQVQKFELVEDADNPKQCSAYIKRSNSVEVPSKYSRHIKKVSDSEFVDVWSEMTFKKL